MTLTSEQLQSYEERLKTERARVIRNISSLHDETAARLSDEIEENGLETHMGDVATATYLRERDVSLEEHEEQVLGDIDAALRRVKGGTFGVCENCGTLIPSDRLDALPWATRCIDCQNDSEH